MTAVPDDGGGERIRTDDPLRAKQVLSQLSYTPASNTHVVQKVVGLTGLEPVTSRLSGVRSNQLSYRPVVHIRRLTMIRFQRTGICPIPQN